MDGRVKEVINRIRQLGRILPGTGAEGMTPGLAARLAYMDAERVVRRAFGLPDLLADGHFIKQGRGDWPPREDV